MDFTTVLIELVGHRLKRLIYTVTKMMIQIVQNFGDILIPVIIPFLTTLPENGYGVH